VALKPKIAPIKVQTIPIKVQTIPHLELLGALLLAQLIDVVRPCLTLVNESILWVDSMTVLYMIRNNNAWKQYVLHRIEKI